MACAETMGEVKSVRFTLPSIPPSSNRLYVINYRKRQVYLADDARRWKSDMQLLVPRFDIPADSLLRVEFTAFYPWYHANKKRRRVDVSNLIKLLHDTICARIGVDDSRVSEGSFASVDYPEEKIEVVLTEIIHEI